MTCLADSKPSLDSCPAGLASNKKPARCRAGHVKLAPSYFSRLASQSRDCSSPLRVNVDLPLIESPATLPVYFWVTEFPLNSRVTLKEISSPLTLPLEM